MSRNFRVDEEARKEMAVRLYEVGGIKFGEFTLTSGRTSPYYVDMRLVPSHPELFDKFANVCAGIVEEEIGSGVDRLVGVPTSGIPFAALVAHKTGRPLIYTRKKKKPHGLKKAVEGLLEIGDNVSIVDDITTTGGSIKNAAEMVREEGGSVNHATVMLDREEGARETLGASEIHLHPCFKISELIGYLRESSSMSEEEYSLVMDYLEKSS